MDEMADAGTLKRPPRETAAIGDVPSRGRRSPCRFPPYSVALLLGLVGSLQHFHLQMAVLGPEGEESFLQHRDSTFADGGRRMGAPSSRMTLSPPTWLNNDDTSASPDDDDDSSRTNHHVQDMTTKHATDSTVIASAADNDDENDDDGATQAFKMFLSDGKLLLEDVATPTVPPTMMADQQQHGQKNGIRTSDDLSPPIPCGYFKCFLESRHYPQYGYTIGQFLSKMGTYSKEIMMDTYDLAKRLERDYGIKHLYHPHIPPQEIPPSIDVYEFLAGEMRRIEMLNQNAAIIRAAGRNTLSSSELVVREGSSDGPSHESKSIKKRSRVGARKLPPPKPHRTKQFHPESPYLVQVLLKMPPDTFLFHARKKKRDLAEQLGRSYQWIDGLMLQKGTPNGQWHDANFASNLRGWINHTVHLLDAEPTLALDFQVAVDPTGMIWHFDLDRALGHDVQGRVDQDRAAKKMAERVHRAKRELQKWGRAIIKHILKGSEEQPRTGIVRTTRPQRSRRRRNEVR
jgi:hypothetical protein